MQDLLEAPDPSFHRERLEKKGQRLPPLEVLERIIRELLRYCDVQILFWATEIETKSHKIIREALAKHCH